jgi:cyclopropane fatty-acyl-phospholipid synthase-like methyltransferase
MPVVDERILGIDISEGMLQEARHLVAELQSKEAKPRIEFANQDLFSMAFESEFDLVCSAGAFGHILKPQQDQFVDRVRQSLRPGGRFVFITVKSPKVSDPKWWAARGFNAAMHARNALIQPPFIMFYLTFTLERASEVLWRNGFDVSVTAPFEGSRFDLFRVVSARIN